MNNKLNIPEILAPCGSYEALVAAIDAGADACYIGGSKYSARAYATNLSDDLVSEALDYVHNRGKKLYLTINTLFKQNEIYDVVDYLIPYYEAGLDAVIVQDLGVFNIVKNAFSDMAIHCSTQMNITSYHAAVNMHKLGATRVVTAREMSLEEIKKIKEHCDVEIESFVHGAMCYSYSGQCLMSSMAGGRSGNRGRCAQPCRQCYNDEYLLSMKDMCTITEVPKLIDAGIDSLKIEGRMKNKEYVASAVYAYKKTVDDCLSGKFDIKDVEKQKFILANVFNRGGFCDGYYENHNGPHMISINRPNNQGVAIGTLVDSADGKVKIKLEEKLYKQDVLELGLKDGNIVEITSNIDANKGQTIELNAPKTKLIKKNQIVLRTRCNKILEDIDYRLENADKYALDCEFVARVGVPLTIKLRQKIDGQTYSTAVYGPMVEMSQKQQADPDKIKEKLCQLGNTAYYFNKVKIDVESDAFVPMGLVKNLRRDAIKALEDKKTESKKRNFDKLKNDIYKGINNKSDKNVDLIYANLADVPLCISVSDYEIYKAVINRADIKINSIYMPVSLLNKLSENNELFELSKREIDIYIELPYVVRDSFDLNNYLKCDKIKGIFVKNIDGMFAIHNLNTLSNYNICVAASLYGYNTYAREFTEAVLGNVRFELPKELNLNELKALVKESNGLNELTIYEYQQVMLSAQCIKKTKGRCNGISEVTYLEDDKHNRYFAKSICDECVNVIYNGIVYNIMDKLDCTMLKDLNVASFKLNFTIEDVDTVNSILDSYANIIYNGNVLENKSNNRYTTGHLYRGVE